MRKTLQLHADPEGIEQAAAILRRGGLVAFPTETVYGLGAHAFDAEAVAGIFVAKGRPAWDPLIVHVPDRAALEGLVTLSAELAARVEALAGAFWPGPLTMLLPRVAAVPDAVTAGRPLVGVRLPAHPVAQALLRATGLPLAAPSANRFGHVSPTSAEHVRNDLDGRIDAILDAGPSAVGVESTVLDPGQTPMVLYRSGAVTPDALKGVTGVPVMTYQPPGREAQPSAPHASLPAPGVGIRHYAPDAELQLSDGGPEALTQLTQAARREGQRTGILLPFDWAEPSEADLVVVRWAPWADDAALAASLFGCLRSLEAQGVSVMVCPLPSPGGLRDAVRDRLLKAARPRVNATDESASSRG